MAMEEVTITCLILSLLIGYTETQSSRLMCRLKCGELKKKSLSIIPHVHLVREVKPLLSTRKEGYYSETLIDMLITQ